MDPKGIKLHTASAPDKENKDWAEHPSLATWCWEQESGETWRDVRLYWYSYYGHFLLSSSVSIQHSLFIVVYTLRTCQVPGTPEEPDREV